MKIPEYISEMSIDEFLEALDDFGDGHHYIHEAAKRIRQLQDEVLSHFSVSGQEKKILSKFLEHAKSLDW